MNTKPATVLIIDCATTGFVTKKDSILEVACILVDCKPPYEVLDTHSSLVRAAPDTKAPDFHEALLAECKTEAANQLRAVEGFLLAGPWTRASAVCNRHLNFDLDALTEHMPTFRRALPKLQIELKSLELLLTRRGVPAFVSSTPRTYRAIDDAIAAYEELVHWMSAPAAQGGAQ